MAVAGHADDCGLIVADYERPSALMVPHYNATLLGLLEAIAVAASRVIGVILLSGDPEATRRFVARQEKPERFAIVAAEFDTPWIRDRAPFAIRAAEGFSWVLPRMLEGDRPLDEKLFHTISARPTAVAPLAIAQGNLVTGPGGLALSTTRVLVENDLALEEIGVLGPALGIRHWIVFPAFPDEQSGHADVHVRFLGPDLMVVAWHPADPGLQAIARSIEDAVTAHAPGMRCLRIPFAREGARYASPVNWIQIGRELLVPTYELTPASDLAETRRLLVAEGFGVTTIASPTLDLGGSLHCLTASVFV